MINLLPPELKTELAYARRNTVMQRYVGLTITLVVVVIGGLLGGRYYLNRQIASANATVTAKQQQIRRYATLARQATAINQRLAAIGTIQASQAKFSALLSSLAAVMPQGTAISAITLTGNATQPVQLTVIATNYTNALAFRDSIITSKRISAADIESIAPTPGNTTYTVVVSFAFSPGEAK